MIDNHRNQYMRDWNCSPGSGGCGNDFSSPVVLSNVTTNLESNLSGEAIVCCPKCGRRATFGTPAYQLMKCLCGKPPYTDGTLCPMCLEIYAFEMKRQVDNGEISPVQAIGLIYVAGHVHEDD